MGYVILTAIGLVFVRVYITHKELHNLIKLENKKTRDELINKFHSLYNVNKCSCTNGADIYLTDGVEYCEDCDKPKNGCNDQHNRCILKQINLKVYEENY